MLIFFIIIVLKNGILPIELGEKDINTLFNDCLEKENYELTIDLTNQVVNDNFYNEIKFEINPYQKESLIKGLDEIGQTLENIDIIKNFEDNYKNKFPWLFN